jgi:hypothetical protein
MGVEGVDDELQELADFSLKFAFGHDSRSPMMNIKRENG